METDTGTNAGWRPLRRPAHPAQITTPPFRRLAVSHVLSVAGDALVTVALAGSLFFDISPSAARGRVALSLVLTILPFGVVAPFLGPAIDRLAGGRRLMVVGAAAGRAGAALYAAVVLDGLLLFPVAFVLLVLSKTHAVAKSSLVPTIVDSPDDLVGANARLALAGAVIGFLGALPGVAVMQLFGAEWVMRMAAAVFAAGAFTGMRIVQVHPDDPSQRTLATEELRHAGVRLAATAMGVLRGSVGFLTFLVAFALRRGDQPAWLYGVVIVASVIGGLLGSIVAPALRRRVVEEHLLAGSLGLVLVVMLMAARTGGRPAPVMAAAVVGLAAGSGKLAFDSLVQRDAPAAAQGRSFARFEATFQLAWVFGALIPVAVTVPSRVGYVMLAVASAVGAGLYLAGLATHERRRTTGAPAPP